MTNKTKKEARPLKEKKLYLEKYQRIIKDLNDIYSSCLKSENGKQCRMKNVLEECLLRVLSSYICHDCIDCERGRKAIGIINEILKI